MFNTNFACCAAEKFHVSIKVDNFVSIWKEIRFRIPNMYNEVNSAQHTQSRKFNSISFVWLEASKLFQYVFVITWNSKMLNRFWFCAMEKKMQVENKTEKKKSDFHTRCLMWKIHHLQNYARSNDFLSLSHSFSVCSVIRAILFFFFPYFLI